MFYEFYTHYIVKHATCSGPGAAALSTSSPDVDTLIVPSWQQLKQNKDDQKSIFQRYFIATGEKATLNNNRIPFSYILMIVGP